MKKGAGQFDRHISFFSRSFKVSRDNDLMPSDLANHWDKRMVPNNMGLLKKSDVPDQINKPDGQAELGSICEEIFNGHLKSYKNSIFWWCFFLRLKVLKVNGNGLHSFPHAYKFKSAILTEIHAAHNNIRRVRYCFRKIKLFLSNEINSIRSKSLGITSIVNLSCCSSTPFLASLLIMTLQKLEITSKKGDLDDHFVVI